MHGVIPAPLPKQKGLSPLNVTIIGSGFAALAAIRTLRQLDLGRTLGITVIAPSPAFTYLPSLIWFPSGQRTREDVVIPLSGYFERMGIDYHQGEVTGIKAGGRTVITTHGEISNDALLIACGGRYLKKLPGIQHSINPCSGVAAAETLRTRLQTLPRGRIALGFAGNPAEPTAIRGGPMFEFLFGLHTQLQREKRRDKFSLAFFAPMAEPGKRLGTQAVKGLLSAMKKRTITTHLGHKLVAFTQDRVITEAEEIAADLILFIPGMTGQAWFQETGWTCSPGGFLMADAFCQVSGGERVFVAGDAGHFPGPEWRAKQAHMAELQASAAASNLYQTLHGKPAHTTFRTELICIVDTLNTGILVSRFPQFNLVLPPMRAMHWVKQLLEWKNVAPYK